MKNTIKKWVEDKLLGPLVLLYNHILGLERVIKTLKAEYGEYRKAATLEIDRLRDLVDMMSKDLAEANEIITTVRAVSVDEVLAEKVLATIGEKPDPEGVLKMLRQALAFSRRSAKQERANVDEMIAKLARSKEENQALREAKRRVETEVVEVRAHLAVLNRVLDQGFGASAKDLIPDNETLKALREVLEAAEGSSYIGESSKFARDLVSKHITTLKHWFDKHQHASATGQTADVLRSMRVEPMPEEVLKQVGPLLGMSDRSQVEAKDVHPTMRWRRRWMDVRAKSNSAEELKEHAVKLFAEVPSEEVRIALNAAVEMSVIRGFKFTSSSDFTVEHYADVGADPTKRVSSAAPNTQTIPRSEYRQISAPTYGLAEIAADIIHVMLAHKVVAVEATGGIRFLPEAPFIEATNWIFHHAKNEADERMLERAHDYLHEVMDGQGSKNTACVDMSDHGDEGENEERVERLRADGTPTMPLTFSLIERALAYHGAEDTFNAANFSRAWRDLVGHIVGGEGLDGKRVRELLANVPTIEQLEGGSHFRVRPLTEVDAKVRWAYVWSQMKLDILDQTELMFEVMGMLKSVSDAEREAACETAKEAGLIDDYAILSKGQGFSIEPVAPEPVIDESAVVDQVEKMLQGLGIHTTRVRELPGDYVFAMDIPGPLPEPLTVHMVESASGVVPSTLDYVEIKMVPVDPPHTLVDELIAAANEFDGITNEGMSPEHAATAPMAAALMAQLEATGTVVFSGAQHPAQAPEKPVEAVLDRSTAQLPSYEPNPKACQLALSNLDAEDICQVEKCSRPAHEHINWIRTEQRRGRVA